MLHLYDWRIKLENIPFFLYLCQLVLYLCCMSVLLLVIILQFFASTQLESVARVININCTDVETLFFKQRTVSSKGWDEFPMLMLQSSESDSLGSFPGQAG